MTSTVLPDAGTELGRCVRGRLDNDTLARMITTGAWLRSAATRPRSL